MAGEREVAADHEGISFSLIGGRAGGWPEVHDLGVRYGAEGEVGAERKGEPARQNEAVACGELNGPRYPFHTEPASAGEQSVALDAGVFGPLNGDIARTLKPPAV